MKSVKIIGLPYEGAENFQPGVQLAPAYIRWAYDSIEWYSIYQEEPVPEFEDLGDFYFYSKESPEDFVRKALNLLNKLKLEPPFIALGGDHFISYPVVKYLHDKGFEFTIIHLDAHLDRRDSFMGNKLSHATVIRRIEEIVGAERVITLGYRSFFPEEDLKRGEPFRVLEPLCKILEEEKGPFYLTLDLDVLDPSIMPSVSNPEPLGISFKELLESLKLIKGKLLAMDIVELDPLLDPTRSSAILSAEILRESIIILSK
ncbi:MAG: arginase family protein [bacterium]|nr:arginase family protein [bacterium]